MEAPRIQVSRGAVLTTCGRGRPGGGARLRRFTGWLPERKASRRSPGAAGCPQPGRFKGSANSARCRGRPAPCRGRNEQSGQVFPGDVLKIQVAAPDLQIDGPERSPPLPLPPSSDQRPVAGGRSRGSPLRRAGCLRFAAAAERSVPGAARNVPASRAACPHGSASRIRGGASPLVRGLLRTARAAQWSVRDMAAIASS
jgi:hypothetical protein